MFGSPAIDEQEIEDVVATLRSGWLGAGPKVAEFEEDFRRYKGADHAVALNSCSAALHLSMLASGLESGDEVVTTPLTFCATVNAIIHAGATPVLADVDSHSMNIDPEQVRAKLTSRTRAILPVHFAGRPCEMSALCEIANRNDLMIIEDCAHAIEGSYRGTPVGLFGEFGCFSFYVTKTVVTGEGGMVLAKRADQASRIKVLALHGMDQDAWRRFGDEGFVHYQVTEPGFKYSMMDLQAVIGIQQLRRVESSWRRRKAIWQRYDEAFEALPVTTPAVPDPDTRHARHLYTLLIDEADCGIDRDGFVAALHQQNIGVGVHYLSIPEHAYYRRRFGWAPEDYPNARRIGRQTVSLPLSAKLTDSDVSDVIDAVRRTLAS